MGIISSKAESLLKEILMERDEQGNCRLEYWRKRFDGLAGAEEVLIRSGFKELKEEGLISVKWADNIPILLFVLSKGISYFDDKEVGSNKYSYTGVNNFFGEAHGVIIQQGNANKAHLNISRDSLDETRIIELIKTIKKYDASLESEYGKENAEKIRKATDELEKNTDATVEKKRGILSYIRDLSVNAGGGLIAGAIVQLIASIL